jgi:hypothetical protein
MRFGLSENAMVSTVESPFESLRSVMGETGAIVRVRVRRVGSTRETVLKGERALAMATRLMDMPGERYGSGWAASTDTCKAMGYATILVSLERFED